MQTRDRSISLSFDFTSDALAVFANSPSTCDLIYTLDEDNDPVVVMFPFWSTDVFSIHTSRLVGELEPIDKPF